jgi:hypothetical protein
VSGVPRWTRPEPTSRTPQELAGSASAFVSSGLAQSGALAVGRAGRWRDAQFFGGGVVVGEAGEICAEGRSLPSLPNPCRMVALAARYRSRLSSRPVLCARAGRAVRYPIQIDRGCVDARTMCPRSKRSLSLPTGTCPCVACRRRKVVLYRASPVIVDWSSRSGGGSTRRRAGSSPSRYQLSCPTPSRHGEYDTCNVCSCCYCCFSFCFRSFRHRPRLVGEAVVVVVVARSGRRITVGLCRPRSAVRTRPRYPRALPCVGNNHGRE